MNGQNVYDCGVISSTYPPDTEQPLVCNGGSLYSTKITSGHRIRLRLINHSSFLSYWFCIDSHAIEIVEMDGVEIEPIKATGVYLNIGQRYSIIITADRPKGNYLMHASLVKSCFLPYATYNSTGLESTDFRVTGILSYDETDIAAEPIGEPWDETNIYGAGDNPTRGRAWEGCDDMPFNLPVPLRKEEAFSVGERNTHYLEFEFRQSQEVNRIFINKARDTPDFRR
jgi:hypothetical protein